MAADKPEAAFSAAIFRRGNKKELFGGDSGDVPVEEELQSKLRELHGVWSLERTGRELSAAIWRPHLGLAEVLRSRGRLLSHTGIQRGASLFLLPEEAAYLVDRANLLLFVEEPAEGERGEETEARRETLQGGELGERRRGSDGTEATRPPTAALAPPAKIRPRLLSVQESLALVLSSGVSIEQYLVYCKLARAGYICQRHPATWYLRPEESLPEAWGLSPRPAEAREGEAGGATGGAVAPAAGAPATSALSAPPAAPPPAVRARRKKRRVGAQAARARGWWAFEDWLPPAPGGVAPEAPALPSTGTETSPRGGAAAPSGPDGGAPSASPAGAAGPADGASSAETTSAAFWSSLPRAEVIANDANAGKNRVRKTFGKLHPLRPMDSNELFTAPYGGTPTPQLHLDVWLADSQFSRRGAGKPAFAVSIVPSTRFIGLGAMAALEAALDDDVPLKLATVDNGDIAFYGVGQVLLKDILT